MAITELKVHNISEYLEKIISLKTGHDKLWFRGHASNAYTLQPTVYRTPYTWKDEISLLHQFKARGARFLQVQPSNNIEWLFIMQHHATPTRLLDWSENAMVALAFATQFHNDSHTGHDAIVWCLNPILLNSHIRFPEYDSEPIPNICDSNELQTMFESPRQDYPVAIIGPQNTDRIIAQRGVFTLFPNKDSFTMESLSSAEKFLVKIVIPESDIKPISEALYYIGITESTLFPELDSISKELKRNYMAR